MTFSHAQWHGPTWPLRKNLIFFSLCSAIESIPGLIEWRLGCTAEEEVICYAFFMWNSFCKQNSSWRAPITKKCELNSTEQKSAIMESGLFLFFPQLLSFQSHCHYLPKGNNKATVAPIALSISFSAHWLIPLSPAVTVCLEWAEKAAWSWRNTLHIYFQCCR